MIRLLGKFGYQGKISRKCEADRSIKFLRGRIYPEEPLADQNVQYRRFLRTFEPFDGRMATEARRDCDIRAQNS